MTAVFLLPLLAGCWPVIPKDVRDAALDDTADTGADTGIDDTGPIDTGGDSDTGTDTDTDTGTVTFFEPEIWWVQGGFGWDASGQTIRAYQVPTTSGVANQPPWILVNLARQAWLSTQSDADVCWVYMEMGPSPWTDGTDVWLAGTASTYVGSTCGDEAHPMRSDWWTDSPGFLVAGHSWKIGVGSLDSGVDAALQQLPSYETLQPSLVGGRMLSGAFSGTEDGLYALGYVVDPSTFTMTTDTGGDLVRIPSSSASSSSVATGAWVVGAVFYRTDVAALRNP